MQAPNNIESPQDRTFMDSEMMLYSFAHKMSARYFIPFDECKSIAFFIYMDSIRTFRPDKGANFTTWLYNRLNWRMKDYLGEEYVAMDHHEIDEELAGASPSPACVVQDILSEAPSDEARFIIRAIVGRNKELKTRIVWEKAEGRSEIKRCISAYMQDLGWTCEEVARGFQDVTDMMNGVLSTKESTTPSPLRNCGFASVGHVRLAIARHACQASA